MATVSIEKVWKIYGQMPAVKDLNIECADGSFLSILGPSGCGKSSTMRMIAGLEHISAGEIRFDGQRINDLAPKDRDVAMVFENYALYPHKSVYENMANPLKLRGQDEVRIRERVLGRRQAPGDRRAPRPSPAGTLRRPEAARRHRSRHRARAQTLPVRRAHRASRRQAARPYARRDQAPAADARAPP